MNRVNLSSVADGHIIIAMVENFNLNKFLQIVSDIPIFNGIYQMFLAFSIK